MTVQSMTIDLNSLRAPQASNNQQVKGKSEDSFSSVLEKSKEKQETPPKPKVTNENTKEKATEVTKEKVETDQKAPNTKETDKLKETTLEDDVLAKEKSDQVTKAVAELLGITVTELEQMLNIMQISLPDLLKGDNLQQLIMQVNGVSEPMDLLLIPDVAEKIKAISSMVEEYVATTPIVDSGTGLLAQGQVASKTDPQETQVQGQVQAVGNNQKNTEDLPEVTAENPTLAADAENIAKINPARLNDENLSQQEEQASPNQNKATNQFLDNLTQSMGEAFQTQNNQVNESFEAIATRHEVVDPRAVLDQIVEKIKVSSLENEAKMNIQLKPEHLGKLSVEVISKQGIMTAQITVENEKTKAILEQNIQSLRESLEDKGLVIQGLEVAVGQNQNENQQTYGSPKSNRNISDIINTMMNEDMVEDMIGEEIKPDNLFDDDTNEVNFIA